ncbi:MAG: chemotaxis protein CheW [Deltaproteobacteria bacterium]|nr:chemotaxis protein CheW [Deltaproteobacteria bacterium]
MADKKKEPVSKKHIDWEEVHRRINAVGSLHSGRQFTKQELDEVLKTRAKKFATPEKQAEEEETFEIVEFILAHERYGIASEHIREIYPLHDITPVPCTPPFVLGIINVRGNVLSVIDIKKFFGLPEKGITDLNKVIIIHSPAMEFGILADAIVGVKEIKSSELKPSLPMLTGIREEYLKGILNDRLTVLDANKLLNDRKIIVNENIEL